MQTEFQWIGSIKLKMWLNTKGQFFCAPVIADRCTELTIDSGLALQKIPQIEWKPKTWPPLARRKKIKGRGK